MITSRRARRRALLSTAAVAGAVGLALTGLAPATAATPSVAASTRSLPSSLTHAGSSSTAALGGHRSSALGASGLLGDTDLLGAFGTPVARAHAERAARALTAGSTSSPSLSRTAVSAVPTKPAAAGSIPPAQVDPNANQDSAYGQVEAGGELYGVGGGYTTPYTYLEHYTDTGWKRVTAVPRDIDSTIVAVGDDLYYSRTTYSSSYDETATVYRFDGTTSTAVKTFEGEIWLAAAGDTLTVIGTDTNVDWDTVDWNDDSYYDDEPPTFITRFDGTDWTTPYTTTRYVFSPIIVGGQQYVWVMGSTGVNVAIYRVDDTALTRISSSPFAYDGQVWSGEHGDGAFYFGGIDIRQGTPGIYRFDGVHAPTVLDVGTTASRSSAIPAVGAYQGDLVFTAQKGKAKPSLYSFDGTATTTLGAIGSPFDSFYYLIEHDSKLFATDSGDWDLTTWVYDSAATAGTAITTGTPTIEGTAKVGKYLIADGGDWTATAKLSYQWYRGSSKITGATKYYHLTSPADLGKTLTVRVTGSGPAYVTSATRVSPASATVVRGTIRLFPEIDGSVRVGSTVTARAYPSLSSATLTYRWYVNGTPIAGATHKTFTPTSGMAGKKLTVGIHATSAGYDEASAKSDYSVVRAKK